MQSPLFERRMEFTSHAHNTIQFTAVQLPFCIYILYLKFIRQGRISGWSRGVSYRQRFISIALVDVYVYLIYSRYKLWYL